nr:PREDICTED: uncharacterized protein LOC106487169 [Apteryx mantelli mantelli]
MGNLRPQLPPAPPGTRVAARDERVPPPGPREGGTRRRRRLGTCWEQEGRRRLPGPGKRFASSGCRQRAAPVGRIQVFSVGSAAKLHPAEGERFGEYRGGERAAGPRRLAAGVAAACGAGPGAARRGLLGNRRAWLPGAGTAVPVPSEGEDLASREQRLWGRAGRWQQWWEARAETRMAQRDSSSRARDCHGSAGAEEAGGSIYPGQAASRRPSG